jgi:hypothetical protein
MRRVGAFFERMTSFEALAAAARRAALGKKKKRPVARFLLDLEPEVLKLRRELREGTWRPSPPKTFTIKDPKPRRIVAVPFRDRVVHHALMAEVAPALDRTLGPESFACRDGKGGHAAVRRAHELARGGGFFLKTDVLHFFETVDQELVLERVERHVKDRRALELLARIVRVPVLGSEPGEGLPIGSLTSQHLANFFLGAFDRFARERLGLGRYARYMDDVIAFHEERTVLDDALVELVAFVRDELKLKLKMRATWIAPVEDGLPFLGFRVFPGTVRLGRAARLRFARRLRRKERAFRAGRLSEEALAREANALVAHVAGASTLAFRRSVLRSGENGGALPAILTIRGSGT